MKMQLPTETHQKVRAANGAVTTTGGLGAIAGCVGALPLAEPWGVIIGIAIMVVSNIFASNWYKNNDW